MVVREVVVSSIIIRILLKKNFLERHFLIVLDTKYSPSPQGTIWVPKKRRMNQIFMLELRMVN